MGHSKNLFPWINKYTPAKRSTPCEKNLRTSQTCSTTKNKKDYIKTGSRGKETLSLITIPRAWWHTTERDLTRQALLPGEQTVGAHVRNLGSWIYTRERNPWNAWLWKAIGLVFIRPKMLKPPDKLLTGLMHTLTPGPIAEEAIWKMSRLYNKEIYLSILQM